MTASRPVPHEPHLRLDVVNRLAAHLRQYPQDLVDTKRLIKHFQVSTDEFQQALLKSHQEDRMTASPPAPHELHSRLDAMNSLAAHLQQYPQDLVDTKRLIKHFQVSADEFQQTLLSIDSHSHSD